ASGNTNNAGTFSGGVMNLPRLLEDWSSSTLTLNTSIVNMFASQIATNQFKNPGTYYWAPSSRNFSFNTNFLAKQPPGTPNLNVIVRSTWAAPPPNTLNFYVTP